jgi:four helix bundle protein
MDQSTAKPYEIRDRTFLFACAVVSAFPRARLDTPSLKVWSQLIASATSTGAHLEEAAAGGSRAHFISITRGGLREMRESLYWLRIIDATRLAGHEATVPLIGEATELTAILTTIVKNAVRNQKK